MPMSVNVENKRITSDRLRRSFAGCNLLVVVQISMVRCGILREIDARLHEICQSYDVPFRGLCIVLMRDFVQLECPISFVCRYQVSTRRTRPCRSRRA